MVNINEEKNSLLDWKKILNDFLQEETCDCSFSPPDRRFGDFVFFYPIITTKNLLRKTFCLWQTPRAQLTKRLF